jgi:hypothetical protein
MEPAQISMLLGVYLPLLDYFHLFFSLIDRLHLGSVQKCLLIDFQFVSQQGNLIMIAMEETELLSNQVSTFESKVVIMNKPVEAVTHNFDIVGHNFLKPLIVSNDEEVDHDDIAHLEPIDHLRHVHVAESIQNYKRCLLVL